MERGGGSASTGAGAAPVKSPFSYPVFRAIWTANLLSNLGYLIQSVGASWLMTQLAPSPAMVALVQASVSLPVVLLALVAGAIADSLDRRRVMLVAQCFMLAVSLSLSLLTGLHLMTPLLLLGFTFLIGCGMALNGPASQAAVGDMVPKAALPAAIGYNSVSFNVARSAGPAMGGAIVAAAGAAAAFAANCFSYVWLIVVLLRWRPQPDGKELPPERIGSAVASGVRYAAMSPHLLKVMLRAVMFAGASSAISALMPVVARDLLQGGAITFGVLLGGFGVGAIGGALLSAPLRKRMPAQSVVGLAATAVAIGAIGTAEGAHIAVVLPALTLAGGGWILAMSTLNATMQLASPRWVVGRSIALYQTAAFGGLAAGAWLFGMAATAYGIRSALLAAAGLQLLGVLAGQFIRLPHVDDLNLDPLRRWSEPATEVPIEARSGPVSITLRYLIDPADIPEFLAVMREHRRVRLRDGARRWSLSRDLANPLLWVERYQVPTWLEYVRHNHRRTHADAVNLDRIQGLHRGDGPPEIWRLIEIQPGVDYVIDPDPVPQPFTDHP
jgi:MFS family permease